MRLTQRIKNEIQEHAGHSIYRMNAQTADCYAFSLCRNNKGRLDFCGGWDWKANIRDKIAEYLYIIASKKFVKLP